MLAAGGDQAGALTEVAQGKILFGQSTKLVSLQRVLVGDVFIAYTAYSENVKQSLRCTRFKDYPARALPYPDGRDEDIRDIIEMQPPTSFPVPLMQTKMPFRYIATMKFGTKTALAPPEGIRFVLPQAKSLNTIRRITSKAIDVISKRPAAHKIDSNKLFFVEPFKATSTQKAMHNICRVITTAVHGEGCLSEKELETFHNLCKYNGLEGGTGLYSAIPDSKTEDNKTAAAHSM